MAKNYETIILTLETRAEIIRRINAFMQQGVCRISLGWGNYDPHQYKYKKAKQWIWLQEEPENMGAWSHILRNFTDIPLTVCARPESASPATGSHKIHQIEQLELFEQVFEISYYKEKELKGYLRHFAGKA